MAVFLVAGCSSPQPTPVDPGDGMLAVVSTPDAPPHASLGDAYTVCISEPGSAEKQRAYFDAFPRDYASLRKAFGFEEISEDSVAFGEYYEQGNGMIEAFFKLDSVPLEDIALKAIGIARNGVWQEDGVGYFQHFLAQHFEGAPAVYLNTLSSSAHADQAGFWKFYVDGPEAYPAEDRSRLRALLGKEPGLSAIVDSVLALPHAER
jgi:hypothetical protein